MQVFNVQGMSCGHCVKAITQALQAKDPAASVRVDLAAKEVGVESALTTEQVIAAITEEGYDAKVAWPSAIPCRSGLAREGAGTFNIDVG